VTPIVDMRVEVNKVPKICIGSKGIEINAGHKLSTATVYNRKNTIDVTENQLAKSPFHHVS